MNIALEAAFEARALAEVPVGAVLVRPESDGVGEELARSHNAPIHLNDPTAHAEIRLLRAAGTRVGNYRLPGTTLYVTLEPCMMCAGALLHARVERVVIGATEPKAGAVSSHPLLNKDWLNHKVEVTTGVLEQPCADLISSFFQARRDQKGAPSA